MAISTVFPHDFGLLSPGTLHPPSRSQKETQKNTNRIGTSFGTMWNTLWPMTKDVPRAISTREIQRYREPSGRLTAHVATAISCMCRRSTSIKHRQSHGLLKSGLAWACSLTRNRLPHASGNLGTRGETWGQTGRSPVFLSAE